MKEILEQRVDLGVKYLNHEMPDWLSRIDLETLDMYSLIDCILGQLYGHFHLFPEWRNELVPEYGFDYKISDPASYCGRDWDLLTEVWKEKITELRSIGSKN